MRQHQFAALARPPRQALARFGIDQLRIEHVAGDEVQILAQLGLRGEIAEHVGDAEIGVARLESPGFLEPGTERRLVEPRLAAEQAEPQSEIDRPQPGKVFVDRLLEHFRIRRRARNRVDAELADGVDQLPRAADAERHDRRAGSLETGMVAVTTHPQAIVQTMHDAVARTEAGGALCATGDARGHARIGFAEREVHGHTGSAGSAVHPADLARFAGEIRSERRVAALILADRFLVGQRQLVEGIEFARQRLAAIETAVEFRAGLDVGRLLAPALLLDSANLFERQKLGVGYGRVRHRGSRGSIGPAT